MYKSFFIFFTFLFSINFIYAQDFSDQFGKGQYKCKFKIEEKSLFLFTSAFGRKPVLSDDEEDLWDFNYFGYNDLPVTSCMVFRAKNNPDFYTAYTSEDGYESDNLSVALCLNNDHYKMNQQPTDLTLSIVRTDKGIFSTDHTQSLTQAKLYQMVADKQIIVGQLNSGSDVIDRVIINCQYAD